MNNEQLELFNRLREDREENARILEKTSMKGVKTSAIEKYSEQAHFIYELLQNADDVEATNVRFILNHHELLFIHNGKIHFSISDPAEEKEDIENGKLGHINSITSIGSTAKFKSEIGKFGIGFKSVFLYTNTPHIYDTPFMFKIERFIVPKLLESDHSERKDEETLFCFPFDSKMELDTVYKEINEKLQNLDDSLLFLKYLVKIEWKNKDGINGIYSKDIDSSDHHIISLTKKINDDQHIHKYLIFEKKIDSDYQYKPIINIAFKYDSNENKIISDGMINAYCFFSTREYTGLKFIVHAPFLLTDSREGIKQGDKWNKELIDQLADLTADILPVIRDTGLLDIDFLNTLPISENDFRWGKEMFRPVYEAVLNKLKSDEKLLPAKDGNYVSSKEALIGRGKELIDLMNSNQLTLLLNKQNANWLDSRITETKPVGLWEYLNKKLDVDIITPTRFAEYLNEEFIEEQTDDWIIKFYKFSHEHRELWKEHGILRKKPIIRLEDNRHVLPLKDHAYLPSRDEDINKLDFPFIKKVIASNAEAKKFLIDLEFKEPDKIAGILNKILPQYIGKDAISKINNNINLQHVKSLVKTLKESPDSERKQKLLNELKNTPFLLCKNIASNDVVYRSPNDGIYLGETYTDNKNIETFFEGNHKILLLGDIYKNILNLETLELITCKSKIVVSYKKPTLSEHLILDNHRGRHKRGLNGFDPDSNINGLAYALETITFDKAKIIWNVLKQNLRQISGVVETSPRQDFSKKKSKKQYSEMGKLLISYPWLPDKNRDYDKPSNLLLTELPDDFDKESLEAQKIGEKLGFKTPAKQKLLEQLPEEERAFHEFVSEAYQKGFNENITAYINKLIENSKLVSNIEPMKDISLTFVGSLTSETKSDIDSFNDKNNNWTGFNSEGEDDKEKAYKKDLPKKLDGTSIKPEIKVVKTSKIVSENDTHIDGNEFLKEQYKGHCQICNTRLDLGNGKSHFQLTHITDRRHVHTWSDEAWNLLCLCPNCHVLYKDGRNNDLNNIKEIAIKASNHEIAPEPIEERNGDFYIANIKLVGQEKQIYYTPEHLRKISVIVKIATDNGDTQEHPIL